MKNYKIDEIVIGKTYLKTTKMKATAVSCFQPNTIVDGGVCYQSYRVEVVNIEDRGDYFYVGYIPVEERFGKFGYTKVPKNGTFGFGVVGFERS